MQPELLTLYKDKLIPQLREQLGSQTDRKQAVEDATRDIGLITGQKAISLLSKKAISNFKLRIGEPVGLKVTLRGPRMYDFMLRLVKTALPRVRDFRGVSSRAFDGRGNYTLGIRDQLIFAEIDYAKVDKLKGMNVTIVTTAQDDNGARTLLKAFGMPFRQ